MFSNSINSDTSDDSSEDEGNINGTSHSKAVKLIRKLTLQQLQALKDTFNQKSLAKTEFVNVMETILGKLQCIDQILNLFNEVDAKGDDEITWIDFLQFLEDSLQEKTSEAKTSVNISDIQLVPHTKRESIVKVVLVETEKYFCYAMISKYGRVGLYDGNFHFLTTYHLIMTREDIHRKESERRKRYRWVTDAVFAPDVQMFISTNSTRSVVIYEASGLNHVPLYLILTSPNIVECLVYKNSDTEVGSSALFLGDSAGRILAFHFQQPRNALFRRKYNDKINLFYWDELQNESDYVDVILYGRPHKDSVRKIVYVQENDTIISCSSNMDTALIRRSVQMKNKLDIFKVHRGISTFALSNYLKILITGSDDGLIRIWNPLINTKPMSILKKLKSGIVDLIIIEKQNILLSLSRDGVLNLWDMEDQKCIQSLTINFPSFSAFGKTIEWGNNCIYPGPKCDDESASSIWERPQFLVMCCNHMALIKIFFKSGNKNTNLPILPPPPLQNSVLIPKTWNNISQDISSENDEEIPTNKIEISEKAIQNHLNELSFILDKDLFEDGGRNDINFKIAAIESKKVHMQENVARGAPYLALDLFEVDSIQLSTNLPIPNRRSIRNLAESTQKLLIDGKAKDLIFSESSTTHSPNSIRSSIVEFDV